MGEKLLYIVDFPPGEKGYNIAGFSEENQLWEKTAMQQRHNGFFAH